MALLMPSITSFHRWLLLFWLARMHPRRNCSVSSGSWNSNRRANGLNFGFSACFAIYFLLLRLRDLDPWEHRGRRTLGIGLARVGLTCGDDLSVLGLRAPPPLSCFVLVELELRYVGLLHLRLLLARRTPRLNFLTSHG